MNGQTLGTAVRLARRNLRSVLRDYKIFVVCIAIGVAAVTGVSALSNAFTAGLQSEGRAILGGDVSLSRPQRPLTAEEASYIAARARISETASTRAMAASADGTPVLVDIRAVEANYPLAGDIETNPPSPLGSLIEQRGGKWGILAEPALLSRLDAHVGDPLRIGDTDFEIRSTIVKESDRIVSGAALAPRVIVAKGGLEATGLVTPVSLIRWTDKLALPPKPGAAIATDAEVAAFITDLKQKFPDGGWEIRTRSNASPEISRIADRVTKFLVFMGLMSVIVGGVGVWNAVALYVERQRASVAILKTVGASGGFVFTLVMTELLALAIAGTIVGIAVGSLLPFALSPVLEQAGLSAFAPALSLRAIANGAAVGLSAAFLFSVFPAGIVHDIPGAVLLRGDQGSDSRRLRARYYAIGAVAALCFVGAIAVVAADLRFAAAIAAGAAFLAVFFDRAARGLAWLARKSPRPEGAIAGLAFTNLGRSTRMSRAVVLSLGLGLVVLVATSGVTASLRAELSEGLPETTPDMFLIGAPSSDEAQFRAFLEKEAAPATIEAAPLMRGRIVELNGVPAEKIAAKDTEKWVLEGDRGITFSATQPRGSTLAAGQWWPADYAGPPLVSLGADAAKGLGLGIGSEIAVNVGGRRIAAKVANLREINWASFGINFVLVFSPKPLSGAPHSVLFTLASPSLASPDAQAAFIKKTAGAWPMVSSIGIKAVLESARDLIGKAGLAVVASSAFTILAAAVVLAGAVAADQRTRSRSATILKVLGAARRQIMLASLLEFALLGFATGAIAIFAGSLAAWLIVRFALATPFVPGLWQIAGLLLAAILGVAVFGLAGNWRMLNESAGNAFRRT